MPFRADAPQAILRDFHVGLSLPHKGPGDQLPGHGQTQQLPRSARLNPNGHPDELTLQGRYSLLPKTHLRKTPTGLASGAPQNGKSYLRSIPPGKVSLSCGLAGRHTPAGTPNALRVTVKAPKNFFHNFKQQPVYVRSKLPKPLRESAAGYSPTVPFTTLRFSRNPSRNLSVPNRQQLPSSSRCGFVRHERSGSPLPQPVEAFSSRRKPLGLFLSEARDFSWSLAYILLTGPILSFGVTPRNLICSPFEESNSFRNAHFSERLSLKSPNRFTGCSRIPS